MKRVGFHVIVLVDEVSVFLSLSLQCLLSSINVGWEIALLNAVIYSYTTAYMYM